MIGEPALNTSHAFRSLNRERFFSSRRQYRKQVSEGTLLRSSAMSAFQPDRGYLPLHARLCEYRRGWLKTMHAWTRDCGVIRQRRFLTGNRMTRTRIV